MGLINQTWKNYKIGGSIMKLLMAILLVAIAVGIAPVFASEVSAASQTNNPAVVKEQSKDLISASQNESGNISKINLNVVTKPDTANVENSTTSELAKVTQMTLNLYKM